MQNSDIITIKGKTGHGKNRVREHGYIWEVLTIQDVGIISATPMPSQPPIRSIQTSEWRWFDDINFEVVSK